MLRRFGVNYIVFALIGDALSVVLALALAAWWRPGMVWLPFSKPVSNDEEMVPLLLFGAAPIIWVSTLFLVSMYNPRAVFKATHELRALVLGTAFASLATAGLLYLSYRVVSRWLFVVFVALAFCLMLSWRITAHLASRYTGRSSWRIRRVLVVGAGELGQQVGQLVEQYAWTGLHLVGYLDDAPQSHQAGASRGGPILGKTGQVREVALAHQVDEVVLTLPDSNERLAEIVQALLDIPLHVRVVPASCSLALDHAAVDDFAGIPMMDLRAGPLDEYQRLVKRCFDLVAAGILTLISLPIMGLIALAIKLDSPGPLLFKQKRVGENGRVFTMFKFRSMVQDAEKLQAQVTRQDAQGNIVHKHKDDPRITRVGRFIRRTSLDELPQFFNVLRGEMSLVGPRPELLWLVEKYQPQQRRRLVVPPGITGWWQVNGRSDKLMHLHTDDDIYYITNYSFWLDLHILWKTFWAVLEGTGAH